jgi:hypothetical protein
VTDTRLIIPKILNFRRIYRKVHEPGGSHKNKAKRDKSCNINVLWDFFMF